MKRYLTALERRLNVMGYAGPITVMVSNGGTLPIERVVRVPIQTMLSGPAAGVMGASYVAEIAGERNLITYDMGGTSTDVCLVQEYRYQMTTDGQIADLPNPTLQIEINSVGAGGGSVANVGAGGFLTVGPQSAGARPGPACYGRGGTEPTVTDANVVLGRLGVDRPLGGVIALDRARAVEAVATLARRLEVSVAQMAEGIINLAVVKMTGAIKEVSVMRGFDPRDFTLFAYGGAGPLHAALVAEELGIRKVIVPPMPGNFSAFGLLVADVRYDIVRTRVTPLSGASCDELAAMLDEIRREAADRLAQDGFSRDRTRYEIRLDMRYVGQAYEIPVSVPIDWSTVDDIANAFRAAYERRYAYSSDRPAEIVNWGVSGYGLLDKPKLSRVLRRSPESMVDGMTTRTVIFNGRGETCDVLFRDDLPAHRRIDGPAIIEEYGSTTVLPPGFHAHLDERGLLTMTKG
jgi:N-methylhydantoinase A